MAMFHMNFADDQDGLFSKDWPFGLPLGVGF
jgi:hypothetical protein